MNNNLRVLILPYINIGKRERKEGKRKKGGRKEGRKEGGRERREQKGNMKDFSFPLLHNKPPCNSVVPRLLPHSFLNRLYDLFWLIARSRSDNIAILSLDLKRTSVFLLFYCTLLWPQAHQFQKEDEYQVKQAQMNPFASEEV